MTDVLTDATTGSTNGSRAGASTDVLIVGSGPTGLTLACDLALRGAVVRVIDQRSEPHHESRGKGLRQSSLDIFRRLGIAESLTASATGRWSCASTSTGSTSTTPPRAATGS